MRPEEVPRGGSATAAPSAGCGGRGRPDCRVDAVGEDFVAALARNCSSTGRPDHGRERHDQPRRRATAATDQPWTASEASTTMKAALKISRPFGSCGDQRHDREQDRDRASESDPADEGACAC